MYLRKRFGCLLNPSVGDVSLIADELKKTPNMSLWIDLTWVGWKTVEFLINSSLNYSNYSKVNKQKKMNKQLIMKIKTQNEDKKDRLSPLCQHKIRLKSAGHTFRP